MTLSELTQEEHLALVALTEVVIVSDANLSADEVAQVDAIVNEMGEETFRSLAEQAEERFADREALKAFLKGITRQDARELIYGTVLSEALTDAMPHAEAEFLDWLSKEWKVRMKVEEA